MERGTIGNSIIDRIWTKISDFDYSIEDAEILISANSKNTIQEEYLNLVPEDFDINISEVDSAELTEFFGLPVRFVIGSAINDFRIIK